VNVRSRVWSWVPDEESSGMESLQLVSPPSASLRRRATALISSGGGGLSPELATLVCRNSMLDHKLYRAAVAPKTRRRGDAETRAEKADETRGVIGERSEFAYNFVFSVALPVSVVQIGSLSSGCDDIAG